MNEKRSIRSAIAERILNFWAPASECETTLGDIEELYDDYSAEKSRCFAFMWYWFSILRSASMHIKIQIYWSCIMFANYLAVAWRGIFKNRLYSFLNIAGVVVSITASILILKYVAFELSYDRFHENSDSLYRLTNDRHQNGELIQHGVITYPSVPKVMYSDYSEVIAFTRISLNWGIYVQYEEKKFEETIMFADSSFFSMFSFPLIEGDTSTALKEPYSIVLSESNAEKFFGADWKQQGITGKSLTLMDELEFRITGVFKDVPDNSHMRFDYVGSYITLSKIYDEYVEDSWTNSNYYVYLQLAEGASADQLEEKFIDFSEKYFQGTTVTKSLESFYLQPLKDIHLHSDYEYEAWNHGNGNAVTILMIIAAFILLTAWVNFINIATARSIERAKEIGIRKVVGAERTQIIYQFLCESLLFNSIGIAVSVGLLYLLQPFLGNMLNIRFSESFLGLNFSFILLGLLISGSFISGIYPAILTSSFKSTAIIQGKFKGSGKGRILRKGLVVAQFALSFILIAGTFTVTRQINYMMDQDLGFDMDQVLVFNARGASQPGQTFIENIESFKTSLKSYPSIKNVTASGRIPGRRTGRIFNIKKLSGDSEKRYTTDDIIVDYEFFETFDIKLLAGRTFRQDDHNVDMALLNSVIINESALELFGFETPEEAINQGLNYWRADRYIVGVVEDHHHEALHVSVEPVIFTPAYWGSNYFFVKLDTENIHQTVENIKNEFQKFSPGNIFSYFFLDDFFNEQYNNDRNFRTVFSIFAAVCIVLSCLGLFGLSFYTTVQRTREIGIRKVLGATTGSVLSMILSYFSRLVLIGIVLAAPVFYFGVERWLQEYAYHINFDWTLIILPGIILHVIAIVTVGYKTIIAARLNPVKSINRE